MGPRDTLRDILLSPKQQSLRFDLLAETVALSTSVRLSILACKCSHLLCGISLRIPPSFTGLRGKCGDDEPKGVRNVRPLFNAPSMQISLQGGFVSGAVNTAMSGFRNAT
jgi:hypothetical protein